MQAMNLFFIDLSVGFPVFSQTVLEVIRARGTGINKRHLGSFFFSEARGRPTYYVIRHWSIYGNNYVIAFPPRPGLYENLKANRPRKPNSLAPVRVVDPSSSSLHPCQCPFLSLLHDMISLPGACCLFRFWIPWPL
jgi:hypothetical protein